MKVPDVSEITANLQIDFSPTPPAAVFRIEEDTKPVPIWVKTVEVPESVVRDGKIFRPTIWQWQDQTVEQFLDEREQPDGPNDVLAVEKEGEAIFRLYGSRAAVSGTRWLAFDEPSGDADAEERTVDVGAWGDLENLQPAQADATLTRMGWRQEAKTITLEFRGDTEQRLPVDTSATEPLMVTLFYDRNGQEIDPPSPVPGDPGLIRHAEPVWGTITLKCKTQYCLFKVSFGLGVKESRLQDTKLKWLAGYWHGPPEFPKLRLIARSGGQAAEYLIERKVAPPTATARVIKYKDDEEAPDDDLSQGAYRQTGRTFRTVRIESPDDPNVYIDVEVPVEIQFQGSGGDNLALRFPTSG